MGRFYWHWTRGGCYSKIVAALPSVDDFRCKEFLLRNRLKPTCVLPFTAGGWILSTHEGRRMLDWAVDCQQRLRTHLTKQLRNSRIALHRVQRSYNDQCVANSHSKCLVSGCIHCSVQPHHTSCSLCNHARLLSAAAALGFPCLSSREGWLLLGAPGSDVQLLSHALPKH